MFKATQKTGVKTKVKTKVKTTVKTKIKPRESIIDLIKENSSITREELAKQLNLTIEGIDWNLRKLKKEGLLKRIGPKKGGHWEVM